MQWVVLAHFGNLPFPYHWTISLAKALITVGMQSRQWNSTVFNDTEEVIESKTTLLFLQCCHKCSELQLAVVDAITVVLVLVRVILMLKSSAANYTVHLHF